MNMDEIKNLLWKASIEFVQQNNTMLGEFTYQDLVDDIHMAARRRHIIKDLQLFSSNLENGYTEAVFMFSPNFLNREHPMVFNGMGETKWKLVLPAAIDRVDSDDAGDPEEIEAEIIDKLAESTVHILHCEFDKTVDSTCLKQALAASN